MWTTNHPLLLMITKMLKLNKNKMKVHSNWRWIQVMMMRQLWKRQRTDWNMRYLTLRNMCPKMEASNYQVTQLVKKLKMMKKKMRNKQMKMRPLRKRKPPTSSGVSGARENQNDKKQRSRMLYLVVHVLQRDGDCAMKLSVSYSGCRCDL